VLVNCPSCGKRVSDRAPACPFCQVPMPAPVARPEASAAVVAPDAAVSAPGPPAAATPPPAASATGGVVFPEATVPKVVPTVSHAEALKRGESQLQLGHFAKAIEWYDQAIAEDQRSYEAWVGKAEALHGLKQLAEAVAHLDKALVLNPRYVLGWQKRAVVLEALGEGEAAVGSWDRALELAPQNATLWNGRGLTLKGLERFEEARDSFDEALRRDIRLSAAIFHKATVEDRLGLTEAAIRSYEQFLSGAPPLTVAPEQVAGQVQQARDRLAALRPS
jgi:Tfp pilus assembly protein PilF